MNNTKMGMKSKVYALYREFCKQENEQIRLDVFSRAEGQCVQ